MSTAGTSNAIEPEQSQLWDGRAVVVREMRPSDRGAVTALHERTCPDNLRMRFLYGLGPAQSRWYADHLFDKPDHHLALVADCSGVILGVAAAELDPDEAREAEVALLVADDAHGIGVGTTLFRRLAVAARALGIRRFRAEVLLENAVMLDLIARSGFPFVEHDESGVAEIDLQIPPPGTA